MLAELRNKYLWHKSGIYSSTWNRQSSLTGSVVVLRCLTTALTFLPDAFVSSHQAETHHLRPRPVDLQLLQLGVLLNVFLRGFGLQVERTRRVTQGKRK